MIDPNLEAAAMHARLNALATELAANTDTTLANAESITALKDTVNRIESNTDDIVEFFQAGKGAFKFLALLGKIIKWAGGIAMAIAALYAAVIAVKTGVVNPMDITPPK